MPDANWSYVALLLPCNGTNGSTALTDVSSYADSKTIAAGAAISTAQSKWGGASLGLTHEVADVPAFTGARFNRVNSQAYTVEGWLYIPTGAGYTSLIEFGHLQLVYGALGPDLYVGAHGSAVEVSISYDTWIFFQYIAQTSNAYEVRVAGSAVLSGTAVAWSGEAFYVGSSASGPATGATSGYLDDLRVTPSVARSTTAPTEAWPTSAGGDVDALIELSGPLGEPQIVSDVSPAGIVLDTGPLGSPSILVGVEITAHLLDTGPLGAVTMLAQHDFTSLLGDETSYYVMDLETPGGTVRLPISSWQATLQTDRQCYVQCVVPACAPYVDDLNDATAFAVFRRVVQASGYAVEGWMAGGPVTNLQFARGSANYTATVSGYSDAFTADDDPPESLDRTMTNIRSISSSNGVSRVSCDIDWLLRPGMRAIVSGDPLLVGYINYYVNDAGHHMDVGERSAAG